MEHEKKEKIAVFRFGVIFPLLDVNREQWGAKERIIHQVIQKSWEIPFSQRTYISRATVLNWLRRYREGGEKIEALYPQDRGDRGRRRSVDPETEIALVRIKHEHPTWTVPTILHKAVESGILVPNHRVTAATIYRIFKQHGVKRKKQEADLRKFEVQVSNDLWQSDAMHGPKVLIGEKRKKSILFAIIDDHSRLIPHGQFYISESLDCYLDTLWQAMRKRGLPRKLYVDNGPSFRSHRLQLGCASLQVALVYARPYRPQGKGKIERFFRTVRMQFLRTIPDDLPLEELNNRFEYYLQHLYHKRKHSSTGESPMKRFLSDAHLLRGAPSNLPEFFRGKAERVVARDRTIRLKGRLYQAPIGLIGEKVLLRYEQLDRVEVFVHEASKGFLVPLDLVINSTVKRSTDNTPPSVAGGQLFGKEGD